MKRKARIAPVPLRHWVLLHRKAKLTRLKVAFVVLTESTWKLEPLLARMESDDAFETAVAVTQMLTLDKSERELEQNRTKAFFVKRPGDSPVLTTRDDLDAFQPDILFLTNPHQLSEPAFYDRLFERELCCYVPYTHGVDQYNNNQPQYNQPFHNAMWKIFAPHDVSASLYRSVSARKGRNVVLTGYPACEPLLAPPGNEASIWKRQDRDKLKIIWAPHHTIDMPALPYANFLQYAEDFVALADRCRDRVQWAFKPHPLLRSKLYKHPDWGRARTDAYFGYWSSCAHCQLEEGSYVDLFRQSDAMIHDSASFLAEYLYVRKPVLFLQKVDNIGDYLNDFGKAAHAACRHARSFADVEAFIETLLISGCAPSERQQIFFRTNIEPYFLDPPSEKIIRHIKSEFAGVQEAKRRE